MVEEKKALVTGGNSGIGYATARLLRAHGYEVTITGRSQDRLEKAAVELGVRGVVADAGNVEDIRRVAEDYLGDGLDLLVNNAAIARSLPLGECTSADFDEIFHVNVRGPLLYVQALLPALVKRQGSVVCVSSVIVDKAAPNTSLYAASKGALDALVRSLAKELSDKKVRVNAVAPGAVDTPIFGKMGFSPEERDALRKRQESNIPMGRYGHPEEVAKVIVAMAEATYVTGAIWRVDGGVTI